MNSSTAAALRLTHTSSKTLRTRALFFSSAVTGASFPSLPTRFSLPGRHHAHDATRRPPAHRLEAYSPKCLEEEFSEVEHVQGQQEGPELLGPDPPGRVAFCYLATAPCTGVLTPALRPRKRSRPGPSRSPLGRPLGRSARPPG